MRRWALVFHLKNIRDLSLQNVLNNWPNLRLKVLIDFDFTKKSVLMKSLMYKNKKNIQSIVDMNENEFAEKLHYCGKAWTSYGNRNGDMHIYINVHIGALLCLHHPYCCWCACLYHCLYHLHASSASLFFAYYIRF